MIKIVGVLFSLLFVFPLVFSIGFHYPSEILNGNFSGNYNFNNSKIGINMTNPTVALEVDGDIKVSTGNDICIEGGNCLSTVSGGGGGSGEWTLLNSNLSYSSGNIGIGTSTPTGQLQIDSYGNQDVLLINGYGGNPLVQMRNTASDDLWIKFYNSTSERALIHTGLTGYNYFMGPMGINTYGDTDVALDVKSITNGAAAFRITSSSNKMLFNVQEAAGGQAWVGIYDSTGNYKIMFNSEYNSYVNTGNNFGINTASPSVALDVIGDIEYTGTITDVSDRRLKENFELITNPIDKINSLTGYTFNMIDDNLSDRSAGLIAQEVNEVLPEAVSIIDDEGHLGLDYTQIVPLLVESVKKLNTKIEVLEQENQELRELIENK